MSTPASLALCFLPSAVDTSISVARSTTWALVSTMPDGSTITPEPRLRCTCWRSGASPKKRLKNSSPKNSSTGVRPLTRVTVLMLTTAGPTLSATWAKLPEGIGRAGGNEARLRAGGQASPGAAPPGPDGLTWSTAPAPQVPRPAPTTRVTSTMNANVLRLTEIIVALPRAPRPGAP